MESASLNITCDLLMQGSMFNTWKPMWVVLLEDGIEFYKRKADNSPKGMIPLKGSSIHSPCQDFGKRMVCTFSTKMIDCILILLEALKRQKGDGCKFLALILVEILACLRRSQAGLELCTIWIQDTLRGITQKARGGWLVFIKLLNLSESRTKFYLCENVLQLNGSNSCIKRKSKCHRKMVVGKYFVSRRNIYFLSRNHWLAQTGRR